MSETDLDPVTEVHRFEDSEALAADVAGRFLALLADLQAVGRVPHVALTGGSIAEAIHREIARRSPESGVDWGAVELWFGDERFVPADSPDRNAGQARAAFLDEVGATRVHEMPASDAGQSLDEAAASYGAEVRASGAGAFDLVMLGMGPDGHIASLFPGRDEVEIEDEIAVAVRSSPKPPPERISLTLPPLCRSERIWFVVSGEEKADAAERAISGDQSLPAARAHASAGPHPTTTWFLA